MNETSRDWLIERNRLIQNKKAIRIAANQNHGVKRLEAERSSVAPRNHVIQDNEIRDNEIGIELEEAKDTRINKNKQYNLLVDVHESETL